jgi:DNA anti-recombination protein RmuC
MELMRESWTDKRLDDFRANVDQRFDRVDQRFEHVDQRFDQVDQRFDRVEGDIQALRGEMKHGFERVEERFAALDRSRHQTSAVIIAALIGLIATQI